MSDASTAKADAEDRLDLPRESISDYFRVFHAQSGELLGDLVNLSPRGLGLIGSTKVLPEERVGVEVEWTESSGSNKRFSLIIECRWCRAHEEGRYESGFEVVEMTPVQRTALKIMVANFRGRV